MRAETAENGSAERKPDFSGKGRTYLVGGVIPRSSAPKRSDGSKRSNRRTRPQTHLTSGRDAAAGAECEERNESVALSMKDAS